MTNRFKKSNLPPIPPFYERHPLFVLILSYVTLLFAAIWSRNYWFGSIIPGSSSYFQTELSQMVLMHGLQSTETFLGISRPFFLLPFHLVSANATFFFGSFRVAQALPILTGITVLIGSWYLLGKIKISTRSRFFAVLLLLLSPVFWNLNLSFVSESFAVGLIIVGIALVIEKNNLLRFFGMLFMWAASLSGLVEALVVAAAMLAVSRFHKKDSIVYLFTGLFGLFLSVLRITLFMQSFGYPNFPSLFSSHILERSLTILGATWGFGFFAIVLGVGGILLSWKSKRRLWPIYSLFFVMLAFTVFGIEKSNIYVSLLLSAFGALFVEELFKREWSLEFLKNATLWLLICGTLFSGLLQITFIVRAEPFPDQLVGYSALSELCAPKDVVLTHPSRGYWVESVGGCVPVLDENTYYVPDAEQRWNDTQTIFYSKDLKRTRELLDKYEVKYIVIDKTMKEGLVWSEKDEGLLFMFRNNETFKRAYIHPSIEIWEIIPRD